MSNITVFYFYYLKLKVEFIIQTKKNLNYSLQISGMTILACNVCGDYRLRHECLEMDYKMVELSIEKPKKIVFPKDPVCPWCGSMSFLNPTCPGGPNLEKHGLVRPAAKPKVIRRPVVVLSDTESSDSDEEYVSPVPAPASVPTSVPNPVPASVPAPVPNPVPNPMPNDRLPFDGAPYLRVYKTKGEMIEYEPSKYSINPIVYEPGVKCVIVNAGMGSGKSRRAVEMILADQLAHPGVKRRILFVCARIQQGFSLMALLQKMGAKLYSDKDVQGSLLIPEDFVVCQVESQVRLQNSKKWDLVIVDEIRSVLGQCTADMTNKQNLGINNMMFRTFMKHADKTLLMDAHCEFDHMVKDFVDSMFEPQEILVHRYECGQMARNVIIHECLPTMMGRILEDIRADKRVMLVFRSKKQLQDVMKTLLLTESYSSAVFDGDSSAEHMRNFVDIDGYILNNDIRVLAFTSKVTVGADCQVPFHRIYGFCATRGGSTARDVCQGFGRSRNCTTGEIHVLMTEADREITKTQTHEEALLEITENKRIRSEYSHMFVDSRMELNESGVFSWTAGPVCRQFAFTLAERNSGFRQSFDLLVKLSGFSQYEYGEQSMTASERSDVAESLDNGAYSNQQDEIRVIEEILKNQRTPWCVETYAMNLQDKIAEGVPLDKNNFAELKLKVKHGTATEKEIQIQKVLAVYFKYDLSFRNELTWRDIRATQDKAKLLENAWVRKTYSGDKFGLQEYDRDSIKYAGYQENVALRYPRMIELGGLLTRLEFVGPNRRWISQDELESNGPLITETVDRIANLDGRKNKKLDPVAGLKEELKWTGLKLVKERKRMGPVQTTGAQSEIGKRARVNGYKFDKTVDITLAKIKVLINPAQIQEDEDGKKTGPKYNYEKVKLSRLLPHYKVKVEDPWALEDFIASVRSAAVQAFISAQAAEAFSRAAQASVQKAQDFVHTKKRGLGMGERDGKKLKLF